MAAARKSKTTTKRSAKPRKAPQKHLSPVPASREVALAWFANLSGRIFDASVPELQGLIAEARTYDLVGLAEALGADDQVLALNAAANELIEAGLNSFGDASPQAFQLRVLRDILNDS
ncbi:MAG: hypothetical protein IT368_09640 [Candidatus Hydrogenedentes bacterium]|nr:hypothetical protein [Candidatus Hydrogenedentota bacterium]